MMLPLWRHLSGVNHDECGVIFRVVPYEAPKLLLSTYNHWVGLLQALQYTFRRTPLLQAALAAPMQIAAPHLKC